MAEYGRSGLRVWDGRVYEEMLPELTGMKGIKVYREMESNDALVGTILFAIKMMIRQVAWSVEPAGDSAADKKAAEFVEGCMDDMAATWTDTISEILSFLPYGWSLHEVVYKRRNGRKRDRNLSSKYTDGYIGWAKLPGRSQDTLYQWEFDDKGRLVAMIQEDPNTFEHLRIPMQRALLFRTESTKDNPEGRSVLRNAYRSWYFKRRLQEIEAIGVERDLAGLPVIKVPEDLAIWDGEDIEAQGILAALTTMVKNIRRNEYEGVVLPNNYDFQLLSSGGTRQFDTNMIIARYNTEIAQTVMADFIMLGHEGVGSYALSENKTEMFTTAIGTFLDIICETFNNQAIPSLIDVNGGVFNGITDYPALTHGNVDKADITKLSTYIKDMVGVGVLIPDEPLEDFVRDAAGLPERTDIPDSRQPDEQREQLRRGFEQTGDEPEEDEDVDDAEVIEAAKRFLGR